jgi:hypothetical protein
LSEALSISITTANAFRCSASSAADFPGTLAVVQPAANIAIPINAGHLRDSMPPPFRFDQINKDIHRSVLRCMTLRNPPSFPTPVIYHMERVATEPPLPVQKPGSFLSIEILSRITDCHP